jgi:hypothetical protein
LSHFAGDHETGLWNWCFDLFGCAANGRHECPVFWGQLELFLEDGFKFAGIATWLTYFVRYAIQQIEAVPAYLNTQPQQKLV